MDEFNTVYVCGLFSQKEEQHLGKEQQLTLTHAYYDREPQPHSEAAAIIISYLQVENAQVHQVPESHS